MSYAYRQQMMYKAVMGYAKDNGLYRDEQHPHAPAPGNHTALIHIRLGDTIDNSKYSARDIFKHNTCFNGTSSMWAIYWHVVRVQHYGLSPQHFQRSDSLVYCSTQGTRM